MLTGRMERYKRNVLKRLQVSGVMIKAINQNVILCLGERFLNFFLTAQHTDTC